MSIFAIADTHLSLGTDKPMDIFNGWQDYVTRLESNWRKLVCEKDTVVISGDVSWAMTLETALDDFRFLDSLPGQKLIIKGNHDFWWTTMRKMENWLSENGMTSIRIIHNNAFQAGSFAVCGSRGWFFDAENDPDNKVLLREAGRLRRSIEAARSLGKEPIVFLHYPPLTTGMDCMEILNVLREEKIKRCYYGHLHGASTKNAFIGERYGVKFDLISADFLKFCPKLIELE